MKLIKVFALAMVFAAASASAEVLLWQVSPSSITDSATGESIDYQYAAIYATTDSTGADETLAVMLPNYIGSTYDSDATAIEVWPSSSVGANIDGYNGNSYYFYIELYDSEGMTSGKSQVVSYGDLQSFRAQSMFEATMNGTSSWQGGSYTAVPEPTGGLMILLGAGLVALRRRKFV